MKLFTITLTALLLCNVCVYAQNGSISGKIEGLTNNNIEYMAFPLIGFTDDVEPDTGVITAQNGEFSFPIKKDVPTVVALMIEQLMEQRPSGGRYTPENCQVIVFYSPGDDIRIEGKVDSAKRKQIFITGNKSSSDHALIENKLADLRLEHAKYEMEYEQALNDKVATAGKTRNEHRARESMVVRKLHSEYIKNNPQEPLSAYYVANGLHIDSILVYYAKLGESAKNSVFKDLLENKRQYALEYQAVQKAQSGVEIGKIAPDFTLKTSDGNVFTLSQLRGKYVVVDFWGSWCSPCLSGIPKMKEYYQKYKDRVEFVGVAAKEKNEQTWMKAVQKHELPWINTIDDKNDKVSVKFAVEGYPTKFILDQTGKIIHTFYGEGEDFYKKLDEIFN